MGLWGRGTLMLLKMPLYFWGLPLKMLTGKPEVTILQNDLHKNLVWTPAA